jgi:hypothetical protein
MSDLVILGGLWKNTDRNGGTYLSGRLTPTCRIMVFRNTRKEEGTKQPDYHVVLAPITQERGTEERRGGRPPTPEEAAIAASAPLDDDLDDEIPF